jgi:hypothetical protein
MNAPVLLIGMVHGGAALVVAVPGSSYFVGSGVVMQLQWDREWQFCLWWLLRGVAVTAALLAVA